VYSLSLLVFAKIPQRHEDGAGREEERDNKKLSHFELSILPSASNLFSPVPRQGTNSTRYDVELVSLSCCNSTLTAPFQQAE
jgi:hypothetical protein